MEGASSYWEHPDPQDYRFLLSSEKTITDPVNGVHIENIGYIDGALHILTRYDDNLHTDNHGGIQLVDSEGNEIGNKTKIGFSYWDTAQINSYTEVIIPVPYEQLSECVLKGDFVTSYGYISGDWQVTFPLE